MSPEKRPLQTKPKKERKAKAPKPTASPDGSMTHKQVLESLSGLLLGMFVSILAGTVVSTSLPLIISDLDGNQSAYTWVVTGTLLATTVSTPLWGKFADLFNPSVPFRQRSELAGNCSYCDFRKICGR